MSDYGEPGAHVTIEGGEEPALRVYRRWNLPASEPALSNAINDLAKNNPARFAELTQAIRDDRTQTRPLTDEEYEEWRDRQVADEERRAAEAAERKMLAAEIRAQFGDTLLARKMAAQVGVDLDRD